MTVIKKAVKIVYRFNCARCGSILEETSEERKKRNEITFTCPVCGKSTNETNEFKYSILEDGTQQIL